MTPSSEAPPDAAELRARVAAFVAEHDPATTDQTEFLAARYDAGLAWVHFPKGAGGLGAPRALQNVVDAEFERFGFVPVDREGLVIGLGMAAPTIAAFGPRSSVTASSNRSTPGKKSGVSCSASPEPDQTWPPSAPARSATEQTG